MTPPRLRFATLRRWPADAPAEQVVCIDGWIVPFAADTAPGYFALLGEQPCCVGCLPRDARARIEVFAMQPMVITGACVCLVGRLQVLPDNDPSGWKFQLHDARVLDDEPLAEGRFNRRSVLRTLAFATAAAQQACTSLSTATPAAAASASREARELLAQIPSVDIHSHAGRVTGVRRVETHAAFEPVAEPMRDGGMAVLCLAIVSDAPTHHVTEARRIRPFRDPAPGELQRYGEASFQRVHDLARAQGLHIVRSARELDAARSSRPGLIVAAEGGDFLEGQAERLDDAHARWALRHLQLTHYRVNELGDIQTEPAVHGGLTPAGAEVIRRCSRLGIVVDVAHGTYDLVRQAAAVTDKPLVLSHTSLSNAPGSHSRLISPDHARAIAGTGGVIGIWPPAAIFPNLAALATGIARMADLVGVDHVALGSDMNGLVGPSSFSSYRDLPALADALRARGFDQDTLRRILGGNYARVFRASLGERSAAATVTQARGLAA